MSRGAGSAAPSDPAEETLGVSLAIASLPPRDVEQLHRLLLDVAERARLSANPLYIDIDEHADPDPLEQELKTLFPALTAGRALARRTFVAPELTVEIAPSCDGHVECFPAWGHPTQLASERRARSLAWPVAFAAVVRVPTASLTEATRRLREAAVTANGTIALALVRQDWRRDVGVLRDDASALVAATDTPKTPAEVFVTALSRPNAAGECPLPLTDDEILIVPRLSALARVHDFHREVESVLGSATPQRSWVVDPAIDP